MSDTEFESFVMNAGPDILRFCRIITNNKEQGDELYQDAMVLLLEKRASLKAEQNSKSYALSVAVLLWKNKKKKYANRNRLIPMESMDAMEHDKISELKEESAPSPETCILQADEKKMIQKIVADLPEKFRIPIHLYYSADLSIQEIAETLKIPEGTVKSRLNKARQLLKKELEEIGYDR